MSNLSIPDSCKKKIENLEKQLKDTKKIVEKYQKLKKDNEKTEKKYKELKKKFDDSEKQVVEIGELNKLLQKQLIEQLDKEKGKLIFLLYIFEKSIYYFKLLKEVLQ